MTAKIDHNKELAAIAEIFVKEYADKIEAEEIRYKELGFEHLEYGPEDFSGYYWEHLDEVLEEGMTYSRKTVVAKAAYDSGFDGGSDLMIEIWCS